MTSPLLPELFTLLGIDAFLAISLATCLFDKNFPTALPYLYQVAAIIGFLQLLASKDFMVIFGDNMRFCYSVFYLVVALANIITINVYLGVSRNLWSLAKVFFSVFTFPITLVFSFLVSGYVTSTTPLLSLFPEIPMTSLCVALIGCTLVLGIAIFVFLRPETVNMRARKKEVK